jgi:TetR/AcrR family transcriptional repressor of nem operon
VDRKEEILQVAAELVQSRGFTAFSYQDLADRLGIRKASIHHHYRTKEALGDALLETYCAGVKELTGAMGNHGKDALEGWLGMGRQMAEAGLICPMGSMSSQFGVLPDSMKDGLHRLHTDMLRWLTELLDNGRENGDFKFEGAAQEQAEFISATMQGAMQFARAEGLDSFDRIADRIRALLYL